MSSADGEYDDRCQRERRSVRELLGDALACTGCPLICFQREPNADDRVDARLGAFWRRRQSDH